jgi:hypothetical protein
VEKSVQSAALVVTLDAPTALPQTAVRRLSRGKRGRGVGSWAETQDLEKLIFGVRAIARIGGPYAMTFTLNFGPAVARRAGSDPACVYRAIQRHIGRPIPLVTAFGASDSRLHLHGAVAAGSLEELDHIGRALERAGGAWDSVRGNCYQVHIKPLGGASGTVDGWARYMASNLIEARGATRARPLWSMSNPARRIAKALHADLRRRVKATHV